MNRRQGAWAITSGIAFVGVYMLLAMFSGRASVLSRRPLLDGFTPPPPYKWVNPPVELASSNKKPSGTTQKVPLGPPRKGAGVFADKDSQVTVIIEPGSFAASSGTGTATLKFEPLDPATLGATPPAGQVLTGNAYRVSLVLANGQPAPPLLDPAHLVMQYPQPPTEFFSTEQHAVLQLRGQEWAPLRTTDSAAAQQATTDVDSFGTFVVGATRPAPMKKSSIHPLLWVGLGLAAVGLLVGLRLILGRRSPKGRGPTGSKGGKGKRPPARGSKGKRPSAKPAKKKR